MSETPILSTRPVYLQVHDILSFRITEKQWEKNQPIPSEQDLASEFKVSVATVRKALAVLEKEELVTRKQGLGTFVTDRVSESQRAKYDRIRKPEGTRFDWQFVDVKCSRSQATELEAANLGISEGDEIFEIYRVRKSAPMVYMVEYAWVSGAMCPDIDLRMESLAGIVSIVDAYGMLIASYSQSIQFVPASSEFAKITGYKVGASIWKMNRKVFDHDGSIIEYRECYATSHDCVYIHDS